MKKITHRKNLSFYLLLTLIILGGLLYGLFRPVSPQVAMISSPDRGTMTVASGSSCTSNITSFTTGAGCGTNMVVRVDTLCTDGRKSYESSNSCIDPIAAYQRAKSYCGQTCTTSPRPTTTPTPTPTPVPTPVSTVIPRPTITPYPTPVASACMQQLASWTYRGACIGNSTTYHFLDFKCSGSTTTFTIGGPTSCKTEATWISEAKANCARTACVATPTPTPKPTPQYTPKPMPPIFPSCIQIFGRNYCWR